MTKITRLFYDSSTVILKKKCKKADLQPTYTKIETVARAHTHTHTHTQRA